MIDSRYKFPDPNNPFNNAYPLYHEFIAPEGNMWSDFVGVKIGDVNISYTANYKTIADSRNIISLTAQDQLVQESAEINLPVTIDQADAIDGFQFTFDVSQLSNVVVHSDLFDDQLVYAVNDSKLTVLVSLDQPMAVNGKELFVVKANANKTANVSQLIVLSRDKKSEIYTSLTPRNLGLDWKAAESGWSVRQNSPNPWTDKTSIVCKSDKAGIASIKLMDATGALIYTGDQKVNVGENQLEIKADVLNGKTGVILYEIRLGNEVANGKMIRIQ